MIFPRQTKQTFLADDRTTSSQWIYRKVMEQKMPDCTSPHPPLRPKGDLSASACLPSGSAGRERGRAVGLRPQGADRGRGEVQNKDFAREPPSLRSGIHIVDAPNHNPFDS